MVNPQHKVLCSICQQRVSCKLKSSFGSDEAVSATGSQMLMIPREVQHGQSNSSATAQNLLLNSRCSRAPQLLVLPET